MQRDVDAAFNGTARYDELSPAVAINQVTLPGSKEEYPHWVPPDEKLLESGGKR